MTLSELQPHLHSLPAQPALIPYRTSYYREGWGFCLAHEQRVALDDGTHEVVVDSRLEEGSLTYGECVLPGDSAREVLVYTHTCHPSLANDNLAGIAVCVFLARWLSARPRRYTYRIVFGPGTIGSLAWLSRNVERLPLIAHGLVGVLLGLPQPICYKETRTGGAAIDRIVRRVLKRADVPHIIEPFSPYGYDERQFGSPGFSLPVGRLSRAREEGYDAYHTSADTPDLITGPALAGSLALFQSVVEAIESECYYRNLHGCGEPQLGRRGLYRTGGGSALPSRERALLWMLSLSDGTHSLLDIAERSGLAPEVLAQATADLVAEGMLEAVQ
jgi:aminopeptidase-like protein